MNIKEFSNRLNESGIRIPNGTHAAKIVHHQDLDGVFSAIIVFNQLVKQGINPKHITTQWIQYGDTSDNYKKKLNQSNAQMVVLVDFAKLPEGVRKPDFWSDHHISKETKGAGGGRIGASEFKSDTEHLALLHATNMVDSSTIKAISKMDSADFTSIEDVLKLRKDFKEEGRIERLAIICNALLSESSILSDNSMLEAFIKSTKPNLLSFYTNILEYVQLKEIQEEAIKELSKENPDWDLIERSRRAMPSQKAKNRIRRDASVNESKVDDYEELKRLKGKNRTEEEEKRYRELMDAPIDKMKKSRIDSINKDRGKEGGIEKRGTTLIMNNPRSMRYIWTQLNTAGLKYPFVVRRYPTFIQVAVNPDLPNEIRDKIDLSIINDEVMKNIRSKFETKYNGWAFDIIDKEKGGHKGITNVPALGTLGIMKKADRKELEYLKSLDDRIKKLSKARKEMPAEDKDRLDKAKKMFDNKEITEVDYDKIEKLLTSPMRYIIPGKFERYVQLKDKKEYFAKKRVQIMDEIVDEFIRQFEIKFGASRDIPVMGKNKDVSIKGGTKEYEFESVLEKYLK